MTSAISVTDLANAVHGYRLCAQTEGKSKNTLDIVTHSIGYLEAFLRAEGLPTDVTQIGVSEIRAFILHLQQKGRFSEHPFAKAQQDSLSGHTVNCYLRSTRAFWPWLVSEGIITQNPFARVKIPKAPRKVVPTFSDFQLEALLGAIDTSTPWGYRNYAVILTFLDTALRVSELTSIRMDDLWLVEGLLKVHSRT